MVPGGITLWPTWVVVTDVQLAVKDIGAVFSSTCISMHASASLSFRQPSLLFILLSSTHSMKFQHQPFRARRKHPRNAQVLHKVLQCRP